MPALLRFTAGVIAALVLLPAPAHGWAGTEYGPPVDAPITDGWRAPAHRYAAGNRGIDYATEHGLPVHAAGDGAVSFAGRVGHHLHVVIAHEDGVRTTYSFLESVAVRRGQRVRRGDAVGTSKGALHFGARIDGAYIDPRDLFGPRGMRAHLVDDDMAATIHDDRRTLADHLRSLGLPPTELDIDRWERDQRECTSAAHAGVARAPRTRRIALLVGGLGSATGEAAILDVDTAALGYAAADVHQFSYRTDGKDYGAHDTLQDIERSARTLAATLSELAAANPGTPIDVLAHSMGGLVTRAALAHTPEAFTGVATIVTLGTPHRGNTLAAAGTRLTAPIAIGHLDTTAIAIGQLATDSEFIADHADDPAPPAHLDLRSIAASTDAVVPAATARWEAADNIVIDLDGPPTPFDHSRVTSDPATTRELALALDGLPPTCVTYREWRERLAAAALVARAQRAAAGAAMWADERLPAGGRVVVRR